MPAHHESDDGDDYIDGGGGTRHRAAAAAAAASRPQPHSSSGSRAAAVSAGADDADDIDDGHVSDDRYSFMIRGMPLLRAIPGFEVHCKPFLPRLDSVALAFLRLSPTLRSLIHMRIVVIVASFPPSSPCSELSDIGVDGADAGIEGASGLSGEGKGRTACSRAPALIVRVMDSWPVMTFVSIITIWALVGVWRRKRLCCGK